MTRGAAGAARRVARVERDAKKKGAGPARDVIRRARKFPWGGRVGRARASPRALPRRAHAGVVARRERVESRGRRGGRRTLRAENDRARGVAMRGAEDFSRPGTTVTLRARSFGFSCAFYREHLVFRKRTPTRGFAPRPVVQQTVALARLARKISHRSSTVHPRVRRPAREIAKAFRPDARVSSAFPSPAVASRRGRGRGGAPGTRPRSETLADLTGTSTRLAAATLNPPRPPPERGERACTASRRVHHPLRAGVEITDTMIPPRDSRDALAPLIITPFAPRRGPSARRRRRSVVLRPPRSRRARPRRRRRE